MQIVLLERVAKLGQMGDVVTVKDGYARNFLLPQNKALRANKANLARFESERAQLEARNLEHKKEADGVHAKLEGKSFIIIRQSGDSGQLYGSVSSRDIAELVSAEGFHVARPQVVLEQPIKVLGLHGVTIVLHPEVSAGVIVNVARTQDEAKRQAAGEDVTAAPMTEDETIAIEDVFDEGVEVSLDEEADSEEGDAEISEESDAEIEALEEPETTEEKEEEKEEEEAEASEDKKE